MQEGKCCNASTGNKYAMLCPLPLDLATCKPYILRLCVPLCWRALTWIVCPLQPAAVLPSDILGMVLTECSPQFRITKGITQNAFCLVTDKGAFWQVLVPFNCTVVMTMLIIQQLSPSCSQMRLP